MYYVYILINPITRLPFYVGVGKVGRKSSSTREQSHVDEALRLQNGGKVRKPNMHKLNTILQIIRQGFSVNFEIHQHFGNEKDAFDEEIRLIAYYGRQDLKTGILTNLTDGGEGCVNPSEETRKKLSESKKGKPGKPQTAESNAKRSKKLKGIKVGPKSAGWIDIRKGKTNTLKGMTYEEIYGLEKATKLKEKRRLQTTEYWTNKNSENR